MKKFLVVFLVLGVGIAFASTSTGMPWESPLTTVKNSVTGPVAFVLSIMGIVGAGVALIWGGEFSAFLKSLVYLILVISLIVGATNIIALFSVSGMLI